MGGSSSRELHERGSRQFGKKRKSPWTQQKAAPPTNHSSVSYDDTENRNSGYNGPDTMAYVENETGSYQFEDDKWEVMNFSNHFDVQRDSCSEIQSLFDLANCNNSSHLSENAVGKFDVSPENLDDSSQSRSSVSDRYQKRHSRRPIRRHHSFDERYFQFQSRQGSMKDLCSSRISCNSLINLNGNSFVIEGQYMGNRFTNFSNSNLLDRSGSHDAESLAQCGGSQCSSWSGYWNDESWNSNSNGGSDEILVFDSPVKPCAKRRHLDQSQSADYLSYDNRNRSINERSFPGLSYNNRPSSNADSDDTARYLTDEKCGALNILSFPTEWSSCAVDRTGYVNISFLSPEGKSVQRFFNRTCKSKDSHLAISAIIRIENPFLHTLYLLKKEEMSVRNGHVDELFLYHGTKKSLVQNVCENNLDWRRHSEMHRFGKGVSFSPSAKYSSHYSDERGSDKVLILFKVLVSKSVIGLPEMNIPCDDEGDSYDTSIKEDASVIVKYYDHEFYPLYKILYNKV